MLLYPRSDQNSDDERLAQLGDPDFARRLRKANPKFFTRSGHHSILKALALAGIVSLVAGYFVEPVVVPPYRSHDNESSVTTRVQHVAPVPVHVQAAHHHTATPVVHPKPAVVVRPKAIAVQAEPALQLQPQKTVQRRARAMPVTQVQSQTQAQREEQFWLKAQAEARAKDRMRAKALAVTAAAEKAAEDPAPAQAPAKAPVDTGTATQKIIIPQPPVGGPRPVNEPWPTLPGGGPCTPGRGPILVGGHGLGGIIINSVIQNVIPLRHAPRSFGRP